MANDTTRRTVKMRVHKGRYFYLSCDDAHKIRQAIERSLNGSYTISELNPSDKLKIDGMMFRKQKRINK